MREQHRGVAIIRKKLIAILALLTLTMMYTSISSVSAYYIEYWECNVDTYTFAPIFILYDPPGDGSYQKLTSYYDNSTTLKIAGLTVIGTGQKIPVSYTHEYTTMAGFAATYYTSQSTDPKYVGAGGDMIFGKKLCITWHVWGYTRTTPRTEVNVITKAEVRNVRDDGVAPYIRADLPAKPYKIDYVPDLRGTVGSWHYPESGTFTLNANSTIEFSMKHEWSSSHSIVIGAKGAVSLAIIGIPISFSFDISWTSVAAGTQSYTTFVHMFNSARDLDFTVNANAGSWGDPTRIQDYIFWFNSY